MTVGRAPRPGSAACPACLRRSWLLAQLAGPLDCNCRADGRLFDLLRLPDQELIRALAGRRRHELERRHARFSPRELVHTKGIEAICRHDPAYPRALRDAGDPATLFVRGGAQRLTRLTTRPVVAIVGTSRATDYGIAIAGALTRGLAASGVTVASELTDGIARAAQEGVAQAGGEALVVLAGGADVPVAARRRSLHLRIASTGAALSELPCAAPARRWSSAAAVRIVAAIAELTIVVEAADSRRELAAARIARALGRHVAAVPGRVTSPASCGPIALLREGASLVRSPADVLDLLAGVGHVADTGAIDERLEPRLRRVLERVGAGLDTPGKLTGERDTGATLQALSELELLGLLARGHGGRYVLTHALGDSPVRYGSLRQMEP
jgi:DNA processing protein